MPNEPTPELLQEYIAYVARLETAVGVPRFRRYSKEDCERISRVATWLIELSQRKAAK